MKYGFSIFSSALLTCLAMSPAPAQAQSRVFVAAQGSDSNPCTFALPCRTFQHAHDTVAANGEIDVLDPAGYGPVTINKAISIQGHGFAGISAPSGNGILVAAGASDEVYLNGILIDGAGGSSGSAAGIRYTGGLSLTVEHCVVRNMGFSGLDFRSSATTTVKLAVSDSSFVDNAFNGIFVGTTSTGAVIATVNRVTLSNNGQNGLVVANNPGEGGLDVTVSDTVASNSVGVGFDAQGNGSSIHLTLTRAAAIGMSIGVAAAGEPASIWLEQSTLTGNGKAFSVVDGAVINSYGDNYLHANGTSTGTLSPVNKQ
jgi:hypothetical protein